jgi:Homeodomain-like domain
VLSAGQVGRQVKPDGKVPSSGVTNEDQRPIREAYENQRGCVTGTGLVASTNLKGFDDSPWSGFARGGHHGGTSTICEEICCEAEQRGTRTASGSHSKRESPASRWLKARVLPKADVSEAGEGWSDSRIIEALETSASMVYRVRRQLVEEGFEAVLSRKQRATSAVPPIFDGEKKAKLIALACSELPKGRAGWSLRLLEGKVVELNIVERASDSTIGRVLNKHSQTPSPATVGDSAKGQQRLRGRDGRRIGGLYATARS